MVNRRKRKIAIPRVEPVRDALSDNLSREEMTQIIAHAIVLAEEQQKSQKEKAENQSSTVTEKGKRTIISNVFWFIIAPDRIIDGKNSIATIQKFILNALCFFFALCCFIVACVLIFKRPAIWNSLPAWYMSIADIIFGILMIAAGVLLNCARAEIENINDHAYLLGVSALVVALFSAAFTAAGIH